MQSLVSCLLSLVFELFLPAFFVASYSTVRVSLLPCVVLHYSLLRLFVPALFIPFVPSGRLRTRHQKYQPQPFALSLVSPVGLRIPKFLLCSLQTDIFSSFRLTTCSSYPLDAFWYITYSTIKVTNLDTSSSYRPSNPSLDLLTRSPCVSPSVHIYSGSL